MKTERELAQDRLDWLQRNVQQHIERHEPPQRTWDARCGAIHEMAPAVVRKLIDSKTVLDGLGDADSRPLLANILKDYELRHVEAASL